MQIVCTAAKPISTGSGPNFVSTGPATTRPRGVPRPQSVPAAAIAFALMAGGMRRAKIEWIVGLHSPFPSPLARTATNIQPAPRSSVRSQSGSAWIITVIATRRRPSTRCAR